MARTTEIPIHGILTPVIQMDLPADQLEDTMRAEMAADRAEEARDDAEEAKRLAEEAARQAAGAVAGVASFNGRSGAVKPEKDDYTAEMVGAPALGPDGKVDPSQLPAEIYSETVMLASGWVDNAYSFEETYPHAQYNIEVSVSGAATVEQFDAAGEARIGGSADSNVFTAKGEVPTVDIPVVVKAVRK